MEQRDPKINEESIAIREKGLIVSREFDRIVNTFNKVLDFKEKYGASLEGKFDELKIKLKKNLEELEAINLNIEIYDKNTEKIVSNLKQLDEDERKYFDQYERLLKGGGHESFNTGNGDDDPNPSSNGESDDVVPRKRLTHRREEFFDSLKTNFNKLDEKLASIDDLKTELHESRTEISQRKFQALEKKEELEEMGRKLVNDAGRLEKELSTTGGEEKTLIDEYNKLVSHVEGFLDLDENTDHVLFSSLSIAESPENNGAE